MVAHLALHLGMRLGHRLGGVSGVRDARADLDVGGHTLVHGLGFGGVARDEDPSEEVEHLSEARWVGRERQGAEAG